MAVRDKLHKCRNVQRHTCFRPKCVCAQTNACTRRGSHTGPPAPHNGHLNRLCWHLWNWFPMAAWPIYCHKHWAPHHVDTEHNHFCLSALFLWHNNKKKKTRTRGCPEGCSTSSPRFNVNLISSLALRCLLSAQQTPGKQGSEKQKGSSVIKGFCHPERTHSSVCINRDRGRGRDTTTLPEGMALKA